MHLHGEIFGRRDHRANGGVADRAGGAIVDGYGNGVASIIRVRGDRERLGTLVCVGLAAAKGSDFLYDETADDACKSGGIEADNFLRVIEQGMTGRFFFFNSRGVLELKEKILIKL